MVTASSGTIIDVSGGAGAGTANNGGPGRFLLGTNGYLPGTDIRNAFAGVVSGAQATDAAGARADVTFAGTRGLNPYLIGRDPHSTPILTPYIPDLPGGAELFGLLPDAIARSLISYVSRFETSDEKEALMLVNGVAGFGYDFDFPGFDLLVLMDVWDGFLLDPIFGVGGAAPLLLGGYTRDGYQAISALGPFQAYATLVPEGSHDFCFGASQLRVRCFDTLALQIPVFQIPESPTVWLLGLALLGMGIVSIRRSAR